MLLLHSFNTPVSTAAIEPSSASAVAEAAESNWMSGLVATENWHA